MSNLHNGVFSYLWDHWSWMHWPFLIYCCPLMGWVIYVHLGKICNEMASYSHMSSSVGSMRHIYNFPINWLTFLKKRSNAIRKRSNAKVVMAWRLLPIICDKFSPVSSITSVNECHYRLMLAYFKYRWLSVKLMRKHHPGKVMVWSPHWCYCQCTGNLLQSDNLAHIQIRRQFSDIARSHSLIGTGLKMLSEWEYPIDSCALLYYK